MEFYKQTPRDELRAITALGQHLGIDQIEVLVDRNRHILKKYVHEFPELATLERYLAERAEYLKKGDAIHSYLAYRSVTPELKEINKSILAAHRALRRRIYGLIKTISELKERRLIELEEPSPDKDSLHFRAAQELAQRLVSLWFIDRVILFGSVARGDFSPDSDIDICLGIVPKWISSYLYKVVNWVAAQVEEKYLGKIPREERKLFDFLRDNKTIREMGFLEAGYSLAENTVYNFTLDKNDYAFNKSDVIGYSIKRCNIGDSYEDHFVCSVFYPDDILFDNHLSHQVIFIVDCDVVALFAVTLSSCGRAYELKAVVKDVSSALLEKYKLDTYAFEFLWSDLVHEAAERIYKGKTIYMPPKNLYRFPRM